MQAAQDVSVGGRADPHAVPVHAAGRRPRRAERLGAEGPRRKLQTLPELRDVATDQQTGGTTLTLTIDRDQASRFGITPQLIDDTLYDAFGQRQVAQYFTQLNTYHVILEVAAGAAGQTSTRWTRSTSSRRSTGEQVPLVGLRAAGRRVPVRAALDQPPGPVPGGHDQLQPRARASRSARRRPPIQHGRCASSARRPRCSGTFQGTAQAFQQSLGDRAAADPGGAGRRLPDPRHPLRELHPPDHDPVDAAVGRASARSRC